MTIDGQGTLDFDDALSIEEKGGSFRLGVHIIDVGHFIQKGDVVDNSYFGDLMRTCGEIKSTIEPGAHLLLETPNEEPISSKPMGGHQH